MATNPLQQFFRQPKIFISLPSHGVYYKPGVIQGDVENIPVFGMTGMDEILVKTPDALLSGESTVRVIESCCSFIKNAWEVNSLDIDSILTAIRIATYGNTLSVNHICKNCSAQNEYDLDLNRIIEHFAQCKYDNKIVLKDLTIMLKPLTYRQSTDFSLRNFQLQQQLTQASRVEDEKERVDAITNLFKDLAYLQNDVYAENIESVDTGAVVVDQREFIKEWIENCDKDTIDQIKKHIQANQELWTSPKYQIKCNECSTESDISVDLDLSTFFANA